MMNGMDRGINGKRRKNRKYKWRMSEKKWMISGDRRTCGGPERQVKGAERILNEWSR